MQEPPAIEAIVSSLASFAAYVQAVLSAPGIAWRTRPKVGEWSLTEVVCHLRDVELEVHQPRLEAIIREEGAFLPGAVADDWVSQRHYQQQDGPTALAEFVAGRAATLAFVRRLDEPLLQRMGQHAFFGPTTVHELLYLMVQHDDAHWEQIAALLHLSDGAS